MNSAFSFLPAWPLEPDAIFWAGLALVTAGLAGELLWRAWRLPRITGFAVIGLIAGNAGLGVIDVSAGGLSRPLLDVALGLLLFELGGRLDLRWIRRNPYLILSSIAESTLTFGLVLIALMLLNVPTMPSVVIAAIAMATSPAMVIQLKTELRAEGQVTQRLLTLTALNSMYAVIVEKLAAGVLHQEIYGNAFATIVQPLYLLIGSLVLAFLLARACNLLFRRLPANDEHSFVALFGLVLLAIAVAHIFKLSTILALLAAGIIVKNADERPQLWPTHFGSAGWLLTVILFALTLTVVRMARHRARRRRGARADRRAFLRQADRRADLREAERTRLEAGRGARRRAHADVGARVCARRRHVRAVSRLRSDVARDHDVFDRRVADRLAFRGVS